MVTQTLDQSADLGDAHDRIVLAGVVDADVGARLGSMLAERVATGADVVHLDLSAVEQIDEHGLVAIVRLWHEMSTGGRSLLLVDPSPAVGPLLSMTGLTATVTER